VAALSGFVEGIKNYVAEGNHKDYETCCYSPTSIHKMYLDINLKKTSILNQGCQMVSFQTKNPDLGKFWRGPNWKM
jgi:hypothetical protein